MERKSIPSLRTIVKGWMTISWFVAMILYRLTTENSEFIVSEIFEDVICIGVKNFKDVCNYMFDCRNILAL